MTTNQKPLAVYRHESASRLNQPTAEMAALMGDEDRTPRPFAAEPAPHDTVPDEEVVTDRREEPEPRLAWDRQGHTSAKRGTWEWEGAPLYTREKVNPLSMIEQLRKPDAGAPLNLLDDFNGLPPEASSWEFYQHSGHWQNRLIHGDNAEVMQSLIARDGLAGQVQMIFFDPPFGMGYRSNFMSATHKLDANDVPTGDTLPLKTFTDTYSNGIHSYLDGVHERLVLFRELLTDTGSLFIMIGDENVHRLAIMCDEVFGADNRVATITWKPTAGMYSKTLTETASYLLWYAKNKSDVKYWQLYESLTRAEKIEFMAGYARVENADGSIRKLTSEERLDPDKAPQLEDARIFRLMPLTSAGRSDTRTNWYEYDGVKYHCGQTRHWSISTPAEQRCSNGEVVHASGESMSLPPETALSGMDRLSELGRLHGSGNEGVGGLTWKRYEDEIPGRQIDNVWHRTQSPSSKRYSVQVANSVVERCMLMSTDPGDLVLDPTCGSGVTAHMAEEWGRRWITIDAGRVSVAIARRHLLTSVHPWYRTLDGGTDPSVGFDVETMQRVSAATLAYDTVNDPENTIRLVDRPRTDGKRKRLTGPFTVESHNPYVYLPIGDRSADDLGTASGESAERILEALVGNPIRDTNGQPVLQVDELNAWPSSKGLVTHQADCSSPGRDKRITAGVMLASPDVTVTSTQAAAAAKQCAEIGIEDLIVCGSAFDDTISGTVGPVTVHRVVTSRDIQIPGLKQQSDSAALTLLGEPDVLCDTDEDGNWVVEVLGYDTYDPTTGELRTSGGEDVDCWMIDTDHDRTAFFPRLVYLPAYKRGDRNIKNLVKSLGKDLDPDAEAALCGLESQPFPPPKPGNTVAVKIITRAGAEMSTTVTVD